MIRRAFRLIGFLLLVWPGAGPDAAPAAARRAELKDLQGRIQALQLELARSEESRADVAEALHDIESGISDANRRLLELRTARGEAQAALAGLTAQGVRLAGRIEHQQDQLGRLLVRQYRAGEGDALRHLLDGNDPNQIARDLHYLSLLSRAQAEMIRALKEALAEKEQLAGRAREKSTELAQIERREHEGRADLLERKQQRQATLQRIGGKIRAQQREVERLRRDEKRLAQLVAGLARMAAQPKRATGVRAAAPLPRNEARVEASALQGAFARLKGHLRLPVRGELANRFGAPRQDGGTTWKGLFIRAAAGTEVKAVAAGRVVFADWLRGFGNLLVVDHDDGFLSVYGNNESLLRQAGDPVGGGETIATVGDSGGNPESGLYFEIRHSGHPVDPLRWVRLK